MPDGVYIGKLSLTKYWTLLISAKIFGENLSGNKKVEEDKNSTEWNLMYHQKDSPKVKCTILKEKFDRVLTGFVHQGSL